MQQLILIVASWPFSHGKASWIQKCEETLEKYSNGSDGDFRVNTESRKSAKDDSPTVLSNSRGRQESHDCTFTL